MGRGVKTTLMNFIKLQFSEREDLTALTDEFVPTVKNKPVANYYHEQGFLTVTSGASQAYVRIRNDVVIKLSDWIKAKGESIWKMQKEYS